MQPDAKETGPRIAAIDVGRGAALIGMAIYHLSWDCGYFGLASAGFPTIAPMRLFSHVVAGAFLVLAGVSLTLAHRGGFRPRAFGRRLAVVGGAAALVTLASHGFAPQETIEFGILHCIAVASLLAAPLLGLPGGVALALGAVMVAAPWLATNPAFNAPALVWLGLGTIPPHTLDWRPLTPWAGLVLLGLGAAQLDPGRLFEGPLARWRPGNVGARALAWSGRHSLAIYLIHQPALFAFLFAATNLTGFEARRQAAAFAEVCQRECVGGGGEPEDCTRACACVLRGLKDAGLGRAIARDALDDAQGEDYSRIVRACSVRPGGGD
ncbi:MAG: heparan-alpha-glucosaminide N-acetyltransferase [Roseiarcus sp.]|jgi:uncharacterized membrane protein